MQQEVGAEEGGHEGAEDDPKRVSECVSGTVLELVSSSHAHPQARSLDPGHTQCGTCRDPFPVHA